jgi:hypothetical protein
VSTKNDIAEKDKIFVDGEEIAGLVSVGEIVLEKGLVDVPQFNRIIQVHNGITKIPAVELVYKVAKGSNTYKKLTDWYTKEETHDVTKVRTDAQGVEFARTLLPESDCIKLGEPKYDAGSPDYAKITIAIIPVDITPLQVA